MYTHGDTARLGGVHVHGSAFCHRNALQPLHSNAISLGLLRSIHHLQTIDILQLATGHNPRQRCTVPNHINFEGLSHRHAKDHGRRQTYQNHGVNQHAGARNTAPNLRAGPALAHRILRRQAYQPTRIVHVVHHVVTCIHTQATTDAFVLQTIANIDANRADLYTQLAVDTVAQALGFVIHVFFARATVFTTLGVIADDQCIFVKHRALEARIRAHVLAHLLTHVARIAIRRKTVKQHPENLPAALERQQLSTQLTDRHKVAYEGEAGPQRQGNPQKLFEGFAPDFFQRPTPLIQANTCTAVTLDLVLDPHKNFGVYRLWTRKTAPQTPSHCGKQKQRQRTDNQQTRQINEILRIQHVTEQIKASRPQVKQDHLALAPIQPRQTIKNQLRQPHHGPAPAHKTPADGARINLFVRFKKRYGFFLAIRFDRNDFLRFFLLGTHESNSLNRTKEKGGTQCRLHDRHNDQLVAPGLLLDKPQT